MKRSGLFWQPEQATESSFLRAAWVPPIKALCRRPESQRDGSGCFRGEKRGSSSYSRISDNPRKKDTVSWPRSLGARCTGLAHHCRTLGSKAGTSRFSFARAPGPIGQKVVWALGFPVGGLNFSVVQGHYMSTWVSTTFCGSNIYTTQH